MFGDRVLLDGRWWVYWVLVDLVMLMTMDLVYEMLAYLQQTC